MNGVLAIVDEVKQGSRLSYRKVCDLMRVPYSSFMRHRERRSASVPLLLRPGPAKLCTPDYSRLAAEIAHLDHGAKRTVGTGLLYARHASVISRRDLRELVLRSRHESYVFSRRNLHLVSWNVPGVVYAIDPTEYVQSDRDGQRTFLTNVQDLGSRYKFPPLCGAYPPGREIAGHLRHLFVTHGAPLFMKRDNASNLDCQNVDEVLDEFHVLAINSPAYYPRYNGGIEHGNGELKACIGRKLAGVVACPREHFAVYAEAAAHDLNHRARRCLGKRNACQAFFGGRKAFTINERRDIFKWISNVVKDIIIERGECVTKQDYYAALRIAVEEWLVNARVITINRNGKVSPIFYPILSH